MNSFFKRLTIVFLVGVPMGVFINEAILLIVLYFRDYNGVVSFHSLLSGFLVGGLCGGLFASISLIYDIESISLLSRSLIHAFSGIVIYLIMGYCGDWFDLTTDSLLINFIIFVIAYIIIWTVAYLREKKKIDEINDLLNM